jgi:hypothetical protein
MQLLERLGKGTCLRSSIDAATLIGHRTDLTRLYTMAMHMLLNILLIQKMLFNWLMQKKMPSIMKKLPMVYRLDKW